MNAEVISDIAIWFFFVVVAGFFFFHRWCDHKERMAGVKDEEES